MLHPGPPQEHHENRNVIESLDAGNRAYIKAYKRNAKLMLLLEQVAAVDPEFRQLRLNRGQAFAKTKLQVGQEASGRGLSLIRVLIPVNVCQSIIADGRTYGVSTSTH